MAYPGRTRKPTEILSPQERLILSLAAQGFADKEIAREIGISVGTVRTYWQRMRDKTNAKNRSEILSLSYERTHSEALGDLNRVRLRMTALFEGSAVGLALVDDLGEILEVNAAFAEVLGDDCSNLVGKALREVRGLSGVSLSGSGELGAAILFIGLSQPQALYQVQRQRIAIDGGWFQVLTLIPIAIGASTAPDKKAFASLL